MQGTHYELHPRDKGHECHIYVDGQLVEKCPNAVKWERLAVHGYKQSTQRTRRQDPHRGQRHSGSVGGRRY